MMLPSLTGNVQVLCKKTVDDAPSQLLMVGFLSMPDILSTTTTSSIVVVDIYGCSILEVTFSHLWVIDKAMMMSSSWISRCLCTACQYKVFCLLLCFPDCLWSLYLRMLGKGLLLKTTALLVFFLWLVKSLKNL